MLKSALSTFRLWTTTVLTFATASAAHAQTPTCFAEWGGGGSSYVACESHTRISTLTFDLKTSWAATFSCTPLSCPSAVAADAAVFNIPVATCQPPGDDLPVCCPSWVQYFCSSVQSDAGDAMSGSIAASASASPWYAYANSASAHGSATASGGESQTSGTSQMIEDWEQDGYLIDIRLFLATAPVSQKWVLPTGCHLLSFLPTVDFDMSGSYHVGYSPTGSPPASPPSRIPSDGSRPVAV